LHASRQDGLQSFPAARRIEYLRLQTLFFEEAPAIADLGDEWFEIAAGADRDLYGLRRERRVVHGQR
jgi:hypothetical protein